MAKPVIQRRAARAAAAPGPDKPAQSAQSAELEPAAGATPPAPPDQVEGAHAARAAAVVRGEVAAAASRETRAAPAPSLTSLDDARLLVRELIARSFPELQGVELRVEAKDMGVDAFRSTVRPGSLIFGPRRYVIQVNPDIFGKDMPRTAAAAILAHELCHTVDYTERSALGMIGLGLSYARPAATVSYERRTDLDAIARGYGEGLVEFRRWQAAHLPPAALAQKQRVYFTAEEIAAIEEATARFPELLARWRAAPPRSLDEITRTGPG